MQVVSLWYRAPELILGERKYHASIDIWSLGCIFAEMLSGMALFRGSCAIDQLFQIFQQLGTPKPSADWEELAKLSEYHAEAYPIFPPVSSIFAIPQRFLFISSFSVHRNDGNQLSLP
jgi:serine/threonine protein kinase